MRFDCPVPHTHIFFSCILFNSFFLCMMCHLRALNTAQAVIYIFFFCSFQFQLQCLLSVVCLICLSPSDGSQTDLYKTLDVEEKKEKVTFLPGLMLSMLDLD